MVGAVLLAVAAAAAVEVCASTEFPLEPGTLRLGRAVALIMDLFRFRAQIARFLGFAAGFRLVKNVTDLRPRGFQVVSEALLVVAVVEDFVVVAAGPLRAAPAGAAVAPEEVQIRAPGVVPKL